MKTQSARSKFNIIMSLQCDSAAVKVKAILNCIEEGMLMWNTEETVVFITRGLGIEDILMEILLLFVGSLEFRNRKFKWKTKRKGEDITPLHQVVGDKSNVGQDEKLEMLIWLSENPW